MLVKEPILNTKYVKLIDLCPKHIWHQKPQVMNEHEKLWQCFQYSLPNDPRTKDNAMEWLILLMELAFQKTL